MSNFKFTPVSDQEYDIISSECEHQDQWKVEMLKRMCQAQTVERVASGQFGQVFMVSINQEPNVIAVKIIPFAEDDEKYTSYMRRKDVIKEGTRRINHPHVMTIYDTTEIRRYDDNFDCYNNFYCIASEFVTEGSLESTLRKIGGNFNEILARKVLLQSCLALQYMYQENGYIHRDIKPDNIMVRKLNFNSNEIEIVMADFGSTRNIQTMKTNGTYGTQDYMAPEIESYAKIFDSAASPVNRYSTMSDVFSLGVTIFQCLVGKLMKQKLGCEIANNEQETQLYIQSLLEKYKISMEFQSLLLKILRKIPSERPDYSQIISELE